MAGFTLTAVIVGLICYTLGLLFGWYVNRSMQKIAIREAFKRGEETAEIRHEAEKQELSKELLERLEQMKSSLVSTYEAYEDAVRSVDERLSPGAKERLSLSYNASPLLDAPYFAKSLTGPTASQTPTASQRTPNKETKLSIENQEQPTKEKAYSSALHLERDYTYAATENIAVENSAGQ